MSTPPEHDATVAEPLGPQAIFDVSLGKQVSFIDFDTAAYREHLLKQGLSEEQIAGHTVRFSSQGRFGAEEGHCDTNNNQLLINVTPSTTAAHADEIVRHEAEHFVSYTQRPRRFDMVNFDRASSDFLTVSYIGAFVSALAVVENYKPVYEVSLPVSSILVALSGITYLLYRYSPEERRARTAAAETSRSFVTLERPSPKNDR